MKKQKAIQKMQKQIDAIAELRANPEDNEKFSIWNRITKRRIYEVFGDREDHIARFESVRYIPLVMSDGESDAFIQERFKKGLDKAEAILKEFIMEINEYGEDNTAVQGEILGKQEKEPFRKPNLKVIWADIKKDYGISKPAFGRKINFVKDDAKRSVIFRDVAHAHFLAKSDFGKPSVILVGSVIEELLRLYLDHKGVAPKEDTFKSYLNACRNKDLLKSAINQLSDSVREFRNLIHLKNEVDEKYEISQATAIGAVTIIFTLCHDFD